MKIQLLWYPDSNQRDLCILIEDVPAQQEWQTKEIKRLAREMEVVARSEIPCETST